jgi:hypothetical protein
VAGKKSRTPPPPRPVQAPKVRTDPRVPRQKGPRDPRRTRLMFVGLIGVIVAIALAVGLGIALGGSGSSGDLTAGGCVPTTFQDQGRQHATELPQGFTYNSFPPTSGPHDATTAIWNIFERPVPQILLVHNLEHGGIVVQYGDQVPQVTVSEIRNWYADDRTGVVVAPLPGLKEKVALTAWTHRLTCPGFNDTAFTAFKDAHRFKGPERVPESSMQPQT